jgi:hypothetical protein
MGGVIARSASDAKNDAFFALNAPLIPYRFRESLCAHVFANFGTNSSQTGAISRRHSSRSRFFLPHVNLESRAARDRLYRLPP